MDGSGNVVVTGYSEGDYYTAKYAAADGALLWEKRYNGLVNSENSPKALAVDGSGNVVVTGCSSNESNNYDYYTAKYAAADGALVWEKRYNGTANGDDYAQAVAVDGSGNVVVTGSSYNTKYISDYYTAKYAAADGALLWEKRYNGPANNDDRAQAVAVDGSSNVVVTGSSAVGFGSFGNPIYDYYTAKYATADGALLWEKRYNGPANGNDFVNSSHSLALGPNGMVAVTGSSSGDYAIVVYRETPAQPMTVPPGLVAWWPGDGDAQDIFNTNNGMLIKNVTFTDGVVGKAFFFDGTGAQVVATTRGLPIAGTDRTIEYWVRVDAFVADEAYFAGYGNFGAGLETYHTGTVGDQLFWSSWGPSFLGRSLQTGAWYHVAVTSASGLTTLYLNGAIVGSESLPFDTPGDTSFVIGFVDPTRRIQGAIDEVSVYNRALSDSEIAGIYQAWGAGKNKADFRVLHIVPSSDGVLISWPFPSTGFVLESTTSLSPSNWQPAVEAPVTNNGRLEVRVAVNSGDHYFRLHKP